MLLECGGIMVEVVIKMEEPKTILEFPKCEICKKENGIMVASYVDGTKLLCYQCYKNEQFKIRGVQTEMTNRIELEKIVEEKAKEPDEISYPPNK